MKKIWNWFVLQSFKYGLTRGSAFVGTREEAFEQIQRMLGIHDYLREVEEMDIKDIKFLPHK